TPNTSFETYFLGAKGPYGAPNVLGNWDITTPINGSGVTVADITFKQALNIPNGGEGSNGLAREPTTAGLNFLDEDTHNNFVAAYEALRGINFSDASNDAAVLVDLKAEVVGALDRISGTGDYTIAALTDLLSHTHT